MMVAHERTAFLRSIAVSAVLGALGIVWGIVVGSQIILLDGAFGAIGIVTSWLLLRASSVARREPDASYPFGRATITPVVIGVQGIVMLVTLAYAAAEALLTILGGGSGATALPGILYSVIVSVACLLVWRWLRSTAGSSELLRAEAVGWQVAGFRGLGMIVGFTILALLARSPLDDLGPYVDPAMVLITCVLFVRAPLAMIRSALGELMETAAPPSISEPVRRVIDELAERYQLQSPVVRLTKVGQRLYLEVECPARPDVTIAQEQEIREHLRRTLGELPYELWLNLELRPATSESTMNLESEGSPARGS
jgi:predicted Co/Zn/Cd cation transporter (cation efflux family)